MTEKELLHTLTYNRLSKNQIDGLVEILSTRPDLMEPLIQQVFNEDEQQVKFNASWVLDHLLRRNLTLILNHLDLFCKEIPKLKWDSTIRPIAHIIEMLNISYYQKNLFLYKNFIQTKHLEVFTQCCFDWLIVDRGVAIQVFAMTSLAYLSKDFPWIKPELIPIIEGRMPGSTAGFQNRGKKVLGMLKA